jgi:hypothetical protein
MTPIQVAARQVAQIKSLGENPSPDWISRQFGITIGEAQDVCDGNVAKEAPREGKKPRLGNKRPDKVDTQHIAPHIPSTLRARVQGLLLATLPIILFCASMAGAYRSFGLCYDYFSRSNTTDGALTISIMLVALSFTGTQAISMLWESAKKGKRIFVFILVVLVTAGTMSTNVFISASELANQKSDSRTASTQKIAEARQIEARILELEGKRESIKEGMELDRQERTVLLDAQKTLTVGEYQYNRTRQNIDAIKRRIDIAIESLDGIDKEIADNRLRLSAIGVDESAVRSSTDTENFINWAASMLIEVGGPVALMLSMSL